MSRPATIEHIPIPEELGRYVAASMGGGAAPTTLRDLLTLVRSAPPPGRADLLAPEATAHRVVRGGECRFTHCAIDALALPLLEKAPATVVSTDPMTGAEIRLDIAPDGIRGLSHPHAVVSLGLGPSCAGTVQEALCPHINLFAHRDSFDAWIAARPDVVAAPLPVEAAFALAQALARSPYPSTKASKMKGAR